MLRWVQSASRRASFSRVRRYCAAFVGGSAALLSCVLCVLCSCGRQLEGSDGVLIGTYWCVLWTLTLRDQCSARFVLYCDSEVG